MLNREMIEQTIVFYREMEARNKEGQIGDLSYSEGVRVGQSIAWGTAADYLEQLADMMDEPEMHEVNKEKDMTVHG